MNFKGKNSVVNYHLTTAYHQLVPDKKKSLLPNKKEPNINGNMIIHGDNLLALKALMPTHAGKINCIYIDPPYNTGNEGWCYNDRVNNPMMREWLNKAVDQDDLTRHDKWCCMMYPRLSLLYELLAEDGVIFISIDDNEQHRLRMLMDEIFGEDNFVSNIIWQKKYAPANDATYFSDNHDFILCYAKNKKNGKNGQSTHWQRNLLPRTGKQDAPYKHDDNDGKGLWRSDNLTAKTYDKEYDYPIVNPNTGKKYYPSRGTCWRTNQKKMAKWIKENRVFFGKNGKGAPQLKRYLNEVQQGIVPLTIWTHDEVGHTDGARKELKEIFSDQQLPFDNPKSTGLIKQILQIAANKDAVILDSFAGSGTTAQAVLELNKEDAGNRKFILVECEDYANKITAERVRRVIKGVKNAQDKSLQSGLGGAFTYWKLGEPLELKSMLSGKHLPTYKELAGYLFYITTGENWDYRQMRKSENFIGETEQYKIYLYYQPKIEYLTKTALTLELADKLPKKSRKQRLIFAPSRYISTEELQSRNIRFCQLPYEIYRIVEKKGK